MLTAARGLDEPQRMPIGQDAARRSMASVPSIASSATQARLLITTA
jgi:hypothetical protein